MRNNRRHSRQHMFHSAGWLFADLFLVLTIIFIAASAPSKSQVKVVPSPTPIPTPTSSLQSLDSHPFDFVVIVDPLQLNQSDGISYVENQVSQQLDQSNDGNRKAGFVLTFAGGRDGNDHAAGFNAILQSIPLFQDAVLKNYHDLGNPNDEFDVEVYFFV